MSDVRALPLWQPWATLVVYGAKKIETRHWPAPATIIGQRIAIHATKKQPPRMFIMDEPFYSTLLELGAFNSPSPRPQESGMPLGAIVGSVVVDRCEEMTQQFIYDVTMRDPTELAFGNYRTGRFAWHLRDPRVNDIAVPVTGRQGIFSVPSSFIAGAHEPEWVRPSKLT